MPRASEWPNDEMWDRAVELRRKGLTYSSICGRLSNEFKLEQIPSEDTVRRQVTRRSVAFSPPSSPHQEDLIGLLRWLHEAIHTPPIEFCADHFDFGLESLLPTDDPVQNRDVPLGYMTPNHGFSQPDPLKAVYGQAQGPAAVEVVIVAGSPSKVRFHREEQVLWQAVQQHLKDDSSWDALEDWGQALLAECKARSELNAAVMVKAEELFKAPVTLVSSAGEARLTPELIRNIRVEVTRKALYLGASDLAERVISRDGELNDPLTSAYLAIGLAVDTDSQATLVHLISAFAERGEVKSAADRHKNLESATMRARRSIEEILVRHHLPGGCHWCPGRAES